MTPSVFYLILPSYLIDTEVKISTICPGYVSQVGMLADTGLPAPSSAGTSTPKIVNKAVIEAIKRDRPEVIINQDFVTTNITKLLFATCQFFPKLGDAIPAFLTPKSDRQLKILTASGFSSRVHSCIKTTVCG